MVRESPPGYGGVERVAHELATALSTRNREALTLSLRPAVNPAVDLPLPVIYRCDQLPGWTLGRFVLPVPGRRLLKLLTNRQPLLVHLPCPTLLTIGILARLLRPKRTLVVYWHAFLEPGANLQGALSRFYEWVALRWAAHGPDLVLTTSPELAQSLSRGGVPSAGLRILPCCLSEETEARAARILLDRRQRAARRVQDPFRVIFIGRLASYKRVDWLIQAFQRSPASILHIVGDGPQRPSLERQAALGGRRDAIVFHGQVSEPEKFSLLAESELLVLPADKCNEAFGIAQLEAMACGVPALALPRARSGMAWVGGLEESLALETKGESEIEQLEEILDRFVHSPALWEEAARKASLRYEQLFSRDVWERQLDAVMAWSC